MISIRMVIKLISTQTKGKSLEEMEARKPLLCAFFAPNIANVCSVFGSTETAIDFEQIHRKVRDEEVVHVEEAGGVKELRSDTVV